MVDNYLIIFKAIANFTNCLCEVFGEQHRNLKLYSHLINKTTLAHEKPILKHIEAFKIFCINNQEGIENKNYNIFDNHRIIYSERVYIDLFVILKESDISTSSVIWKHILTISALVNPSGKAKQILKEASTKSSSSNDEMDFLTNIIDKVEQNVSPDDNPMQAISSIMKSGVFQELISGMGNGLQNGTLDLNKLMGTVQSMVKDINHENGGGETDDSMNMINTLMSSMQTNNSEDGGQTNNPPDLSGIMSMMGPLLNNMNKQ
jgi:hypothetical protein